MRKILSLCSFRKKSLSQLREWSVFFPFWRNLADVLYFPAALQLTIRVTNAPTNGKKVKRKTLPTVAFDCDVIQP